MLVQKLLHALCYFFPTALAHNAVGKLPGIRAPYVLYALVYLYFNSIHHACPVGFLHKLLCCCVADRLALCSPLGYLFAKLSSFLVFRGFKFSRFLAKLLCICTVAVCALCICSVWAGHVYAVLDCRRTRAAYCAAYDVPHNTLGIVAPLGFSCLLVAFALFHPRGDGAVDGALVTHNKLVCYGVEDACLTLFQALKARLNKCRLENPSCHALVCVQQVLHRDKLCRRFCNTAEQTKRHCLLTCCAPAHCIVKALICSRAEEQCQCTRRACYVAVYKALGHGVGKIVEISKPLFTDTVSLVQCLCSAPADCLAVIAEPGCRAAGVCAGGSHPVGFIHKLKQFTRHACHIGYSANKAAPGVCKGCTHCLLESLRIVQ